MAPCHDATIRDIDSKTLKTAIDEGISKGRIPADAAAAKTTVDRLRPFKVLTQGDIITNGAIALFGRPRLASSITARSAWHGLKARLWTSSVTRPLWKPTFSSSFKPLRTSAANTCSCRETKMISTVRMN